MLVIIAVDVYEQKLEQPICHPREYTLDELLANEVEISEEVHWGKAEGREVW
ncbi:hypothetical protein [Moorena producens]|uniref:hypothetical protein n=1 Tax=Moorena producens TaxID=1155739 RepID=UPI0013142BD3|nr:hypothetical protein [Moorena producens]